MKPRKDKSVKVQDIRLQIKNPKNRGIEDLQQQVLLSDLDHDSRERDQIPELVFGIKPRFGNVPNSGDGPLANMLLNAQHNQNGKNRVLIVEDNSF